MGKLLAIALVFAAATVRGEGRQPPPASAGAPAASPPASAAKHKAAPKRDGKKRVTGEKGANGTKAAEDTKPASAGAKPEEKPCEPVKPCPID